MGSEVIPQGATGVRETLSTEDFKGRRTFKCSYINSLWAWPPTPLGAQYRKKCAGIHSKVHEMSKSLQNGKLTSCVQLI